MLDTLFLLCHILLLANTFACILCLACAYMYEGVSISLHLDEHSTTLEQLLFICARLVSPGMYLAKYIWELLGA